MARTRRRVPAIRIAPRPLAWALAPAILALLAASCSGGSNTPGVARVSSGHASPASHAGALAFAACVRSHGVPEFPDPGGAMPPGLTKPQFATAMRACRALLRQSQGDQVSAADKTSFPRYSACVRAHGFLDYPDAVFLPHGGMVMTLPPGMSDNSPLLQAAQKPCHGDLPGDAPKGAPKGG